MKSKKIKHSEILSIEACKKRLRQAQAKGNYKEVAEIHNQLGNDYRLLSRFEDALEEHQKEAEVCKKYNQTDKMGLGIAYRNIGEVYIDMKEADKAIPFIKQYMKIATEQHNFVEEQRALITLARIYLYKAENDEAEDNEDLREQKLDFAESYFRKAYKLMNDSNLKQQLNNEKEFMTMKCNNCMNLGLTLDTKDKPSEAVMWLNKAVDIGRKYALYDYLHNCNTVLSSIYLKLNQHKEALTAAKASTVAAKALGDLPKECDSAIAEAKAMFSMNEIDSGKKILKKIRKKVKGKESCSSLMENLDSLLIPAVKLCRRLDNIPSVDADDFYSRMTLNEEIADNYTALSVFDEAVKHYVKAVEFAEKAGVEGKKLSRLYFSIAETYNDQKDFRNALKYYEKEMTLHDGNPVEQFKTQTNITVVLERLESNSNDIINAHHSAIKMATETKNPKREATAYQNLGMYLKSINKSDESENMLKKVEKIKILYNLSDLDLEDLEGDSQDDVLDDEVDLDNLSSDDDSDEDENSEDLKHQVGGKRKVSQRKNEAGETPLHLAAKRGDLKAVRKLLRQGHEVNVRDTAGWTPLHEAANFGNVEVIAELLKHGARVNDRGLSQCEGITPLHDSAGNGHLGAVELLLDHGANVLALDDSKYYPIDHLVIWRHGDGNDMESEVQGEYKRIKRLLCEKMAKRGKVYTKQDELRAAKRTKMRNDAPKSSIMKSKTGEGDDALIPCKIAVDTYDPDDVDEATEFYRSTIQALARNGSRRPRKKVENERPISPGPRTALIPSHLDVHDDWMLDDESAFPELENNQTTRSKATTKRKRDPVDDIIFKERTTRRRRNGKRNEIAEDVSRRNRRKSTQEENEASEDEEGLQSSEELMDLDNDSDPILSLNELGRDSSQQFSGTGNESPSVIGPTQRSTNSPLENDFLMSQLNEDEDIIPHDLLEEDMSFLPSQIQLPKSDGRIFGRMNERDLAADSMDLNGRERPSRRNSEGSQSQLIFSRSNRPPVHLISSDDDEDVNESREECSSKKRHSFSSISAAFAKQSALNKGDTGSKSKSSKYITVQTRLPFTRVSTGAAPGDSRSEDSRSPELRRTASSSSILLSRHPSERSEVTKKPSEVLRLKIQVLEHTLLVPVEEENLTQTVEWLCEECASRYLRAYGVKPILSLNTKDGAQLDPSDPISLVLGGAEIELVAEVTAYDLPPLTQRFQSSCLEFKTDVDGDIISAMNMCQSSNILNLSDISLRGNYSKALFQSLQRQHSLRELLLSSCSLFDEGIKEFCKVANTLPGLTNLDLSSNGMTLSGFHSLFETLEKAKITARMSCGPLGLTTLTLSHNPLGNRIGKNLADLLSILPSLKNIAISDCNFSEKLFLPGRNEFMSAFSKLRLEELDVSCNNWSEIGVEILLQGLNPSRLRILDISSPGVKENAETFSRIFANFLCRNEDFYNLKELKLSDCGITDTGLWNILQQFHRLVKLESLDLSNNEAITSVSIEEVLTQCETHNVPLTRLDIGCCPNLWEEKPIAPERILLALERKLQIEPKIKYLRLTADGVPNYTTWDSEYSELTKLESRIASLWNDYAGSANSLSVKEGSCTVFEYE